MARSLPDIPPLKVVKQIFPGATLRCGDASLTELLRQASRGLIDIPTAGPRAKLKFFDEIRERGGIPRDGGSQLSGLEAAFESYAPDFRKLGLSPPRLRKLNPGSWDDDLVPWLRKGPEHLALFGEFYGTFNWLIRGRTDILSGQPGLRMDHWTGLKGSREGRRFQQSDPLADGRRRGIAKGPQDIPMRMLRLSAGAWDKVDSRAIGRGLVVAGLVRAAHRLDEEPVPIPEPTPLLEPTDDAGDACRDVRRELRRLTTRHESLFERHAELRDENEALEAELVEWRDWANSHPDDPTETGAEPTDPTGVDPD